MEDQSIQKAKTKWKPLFTSEGSGFLYQMKLLITPFGEVSHVDLNIIRFIQLGIFLLLWTFVKIQFVPTLPEVLTKGLDMFLTEGLAHDFIVSLKTCLLSMFYATCLSCLIGYASSIPLLRPICLLITKGRFLSLAGLYFFFIVLFKGGEPLKDSLMVYSITVFFTDSFITIINNIDESTYNHVRTLRMGPWETLYEVVILGKFADMLMVARQTFAMAWMSLTLVEGIVKQDGIGVVLLLKDRTANFAGIFVIALLIIIVGIGVDKGIDLLRKTICPYSDLALKKS